MGHGPSNEQMEQRQALNKFHMEALVKSKRNGKNKDVSIVDVRESFEVKKYGAIPFSVHIPSSEVRNAFLMSPAAFEARYKARMPDKYDKIVFYDQRHGRAVAAAELVESLGYTSATVFVDGYAGWLKSIDNAGREDL
ncbi:Rhodanese like domain [Trypanosoma vivax]|uniref:Rhodanese domain-containing protein n=1 Tax=Trypanosoma vivax (strain Y486) TaxID=1055687 RepID=G0U8N5_TRYVY|nr:hypothetical protein TRVL_06600 [Trypanosoma vivax]KAH8604930.1 Rhodanese like domain [Trypanosoma vivax]CCC53962.1 conserved hypothetical protein [Trypanosoma vivax Y486]